MTSSRPNPWFLRTTVVAIIAAVVLIGRYRKEIDTFFEPVFRSVEAMGFWSPVLLALLYIPACLLLIPNTFLSPAVGFLLGPVWGTVVAVIGLTMGHSANFGLARLLGRPWVQRRVPDSPKLRALELACERDGFRMVFLTRLTPVFPSNIMSYFFGATSVTIPSYAAATAIGLFPRTLVNTWLGATAKSLSDTAGSGAHDQPLERYFKYAALAITIVVVIYIARVARLTLMETLATQTDAEPKPTK